MAGISTSQPTCCGAILPPPTLLLGKQPAYRQFVGPTSQLSSRFVPQPLGGIAKTLIHLSNAQLFKGKQVHC